MSEEEKKAIEWFKKDLMFWLIEGKDYVIIDNGEIPKMKSLLNLMDKQQKEIEEKTTILLAGAEKVKQLEKGNRSLMESRIKWKNRYYKEKEKIAELQTKLEIETIDNKYNQEERDEETIPRCKIREKIKEIKNKNEENKIELAKGIDTLNFDIIENAKNNILINVNVRDILKELLEDK